MDVFYACRLDNEEEVEEHFDDPLRGETDKVLEVKKSDECEDSEEDISRVLS